MEIFLNSDPLSYGLLFYAITKNAKSIILDILAIFSIK